MPGENLSKDQVKPLVLRLRDIAAVLATADPKHKAEVHGSWGFRCATTPTATWSPCPPTVYYRTCRRTEPKLCSVALYIGGWLVRTASGCLTYGRHRHPGSSRIQWLGP